MKFTELEAKAKKLKEQATALLAEVDGLMKDVEGAATRRDGLVGVLLCAREKLREAKARDESRFWLDAKFTLPSYRQAVGAGFHGSPVDWDEVVRAGITNDNGGRMNVLQQAQERAVRAGQPMPKLNS